MERNRRVFSVAALLGLVVGCGDPTPAAPVERVPTVKVMTVGEVADSRRGFSGRVRAAERVDMSFQVSGRLTELPIKQGQEVAAGDLIGQLDDRDFQSNVRSTRALAEEAAENLQRGLGLIERDFISRAELARLQARADTTSADLARAEKALEDTTLLAPFDGTVARRMVENFQEITANQVVASVQDNTVIEIVASAPERLVARSNDLTTIDTRAVFDSLPGQSYDVSIKEFSTEADPQTQTFEYVLVMPKPADANILPGMTATVYVIALGGVPRNGEGYTVPAAAIFADNTGASHVWVVADDNSVSQRAVTTGDLRGSSEIVITDGLEAGEVIAAAGVHQIRAGMTVRPVTSITY